MSTQKHSLVVARYREELDWLLKVPENYEIFLYNKGPELKDTRLYERCRLIEDLDNTGRESHTYLHHIQSGAGRNLEKTVFSQGDPKEHSPDFLALLAVPELWNPTQALSCRWKEDPQVPPAYQLEHEIGDQIGRCRVREEWFSLGTWAPLSFHDRGAFDLGISYLTTHGLPGGWNIAGHFLEMCGMDELAEQAWRAQLGKFSYGAIFATDTERLDRLEGRGLDRMLTLSRSHGIYGYVLERLWLHLFGHSFIRVDALHKVAEYSPVVAVANEVTVTSPKHPLILVTPTYARKDRLAYLQRWVQRLQGVDEITWLVVEDASVIDADVEELLTESGIPHHYWACGPTRMWGNAQRESALQRIVELKLSGVIYFMDDDNDALPQLFLELRTVQRLALLPVGNLGPNQVERPVVKDGKIFRWEAGWLERRYPVDMAGFAFHSSLLAEMSPPYWDFVGPGRGGESEFLSKLAPDETVFEFLCHDCTRCVVWHNAPLASACP
jgi:hypothetical protein